MKKAFSFLAVLAFVGFTAFKGKVADDTFTVDVDKSTVTWIGKKVTGQHSGTVKLNSGTLVMAGNNLKSGTFTMNMASMTSPDGDRLMTHLKSEDFFSVEKNPTSTFVITKVSPVKDGQVTIMGNLTIKGTTNPVTFPATVQRSGSALTATAKSVKVDRTKYDIRYGSKSFFASIGDKAIDDEFELGVNLVAAKK